LYVELNYKFLNHFSFKNHQKSNFKTNTDALAELILSYSDVLADPQQAFHGLPRGPLVGNHCTRCFDIILLVLDAS